MLFIKEFDFIATTSKPKLTFRHLKKGVQEFHRKFLAPADKTATTVVVVWRINILKQELDSSKTDEHNLRDMRYVVEKHRCHMAAMLGVSVDENHGKLPTL